jgi:FHS family glucose/mannose:H+ symporter-like MFS transporter
MILLAVSFAIASLVLIEISESIGSSVALVGLIFTFFSLGYIPGALLSNLMSKYVKRKILYSIILFFHFGLFILFALSRNLYGAYISFLLLGICCGLLDVTVNTILVDLYIENTGSSLNLVHVFFGFGAFLGSTISSQVVGRGLSWTVSFYLTACLILINFMISLFIKLPAPESYMQRDSLGRSKSNMGSETASIDNMPRLAIGILLLLIFAQFCSNVTQNGFNMWMPTFLRVGRGFSGLFAGQILSFFWVIIGIGRFVVGMISRKIKLEKILIFSCFFCFILAIISVAINNKFIELVSFLFTGAFLLGIFPSVLAVGSAHFRKRKDLVISILVMFGVMGGLFSSFFMSVIYKFTGNLNIGMFAIASFMLNSFVMFIIFYLINKRKINAKVGLAD